MDTRSRSADDVATLKSTAVIRLTEGSGGKMSTDLSGQFEAHEKQGVRTFLVDLDGVSYVNSNMLALLVRLKRRALDANCEFQLINVSAHVMNILRTTRLLDFFFPVDD